MNKKIIIILGIILIIVSAVLIFNKVKTDRIDYQITQINTYNFFKYVENEKVGIIDKDGKVLIKADYEDIIIPNPEKDIFICYNKDGKGIVLNSSNKVLFEKYDSIEPIELKNIVSVLSYEKSVLKYEKDGKYGLVDFEGNEKTKNIYTSIENLQSTEGKFLVYENGKYGVINLNGNTLVEAKYDQIITDGVYSEEKGYTNSGFITGIKTENGYRYGYISYDTRKVLNEEFNDLIRVPNSEKLYIIAAKNGRYGLYENSKEIIPAEYQSISYCDNGALIIEKNKNYGIANLNGKIVVDTKYTDIQSKGIYLYAYSLNENQVYDANGNQIDINFDKVVYDTENKEYRIFTLTNNDVTYYGIENTNGKTLVTPSYNYIEYVFKDYFVAKDDSGKLGVINANGKTIINFDFDTLQKIKGNSLLQAVKHDTDKTEIYSSSLERICTIDDASINNENGYIVIFNKKETIYIDNNGNKLEKDSEAFQNAMTKNFPETIGEYKKVQASLDNIYYIIEK